MAGRTSEPVGQARHSCQLIERHDITERIGPAGGLAPDVNAAYARCKALAEGWADAHGLAILDLSALSSSDGTAGVTFTVDVGHGDIDLDQRVPGVLDRWRWSARMLWWRKVFSNGDGRQGRILARREDEDRADVIPLTERHTPPRVGTMRASARTPGCTCPLGGPFRDICPVHYAPAADPGPVAVRASAPRCSLCYGVGGHTPGCSASDQPRP